MKIILDLSVRVLLIKGIKTDEMYWSSPSELESDDLSDDDLDTSTITLT